MEGLLTYLDEEEEEVGVEEGKKGHLWSLSRKEEGVRLEANEETERSGLHSLASFPTLAAFSPTLPQLSLPPAPPPFPVAYTSKDTTVRPRRVGKKSRKRPRDGNGGGGGGRGVRWADAALLEEIFPFFTDQPVDPTAPPIGMTPSASSPRSYSFSSDMEEDEEAASSSMHGPTSTGRPSLSHSSSSSSSNGGGGLKHASWETVVVTRKKKNKPLVSLPLMEGKWANSPPSSSSEAETPAAAAAGKGKLYDPAGFEFFCDACHYTLVEGEVRYECQVCPNEFCLCRSCFASPSSSSSSSSAISHPHPCVANTRTYHISFLVKDKRDGGREEEDGDNNGHDEEQKRAKDAQEEKQEEEEEEEEDIGPLLGSGGGPRFGGLTYAGSL